MRHAPWRARGANGCAATPRRGEPDHGPGPGKGESVNGEEGVGATTTWMSSVGPNSRGLPTRSTSTTPASVLSRSGLRLTLERFNRRRAAPHLLPDREMFAMLSDTRENIARLIGASSDEIALTLNTGYGIGMAARALPLEPGDIVLVSDKEFPANVYPWMRLGDRGVGDGARAHHGGRLARRGPAAGAPARPARAGARGVPGAIQQRLSRGSRAALRRHPRDRRVSRGGCHPGCGSAAGGRLRGSRWTCSPAAPRSGSSRPGAPDSCTSGAS